MAQKEQLRNAGDKKQRQLKETKRRADQAGPHGKQAHQIAQRANMKRQQKQMHKQDNK